MKITDLLTALKPPHMFDNGGDMDLSERTQRHEFRVRRWRWSVFYGLVAALLIGGSIHALAWGWTPVYPGFASIDETRANAEQSRRIEVRLLEQDLLSTRIGQCSATDKRFFTQRLNELLREYRQMTHEQWRVPECEEVQQ